MNEFKTKLMKKEVLFGIFVLVLVGVVFLVKNGIEATRNAIIVKGLLEKIAAGQGGIQAYPPPPRTLELTEEEVNAGMDLLCGAGNPIIQGLDLLKNFRKLKIPFPQKELPTNPGQPIPIALPCQYFQNFQVKFLPGKYSASARLLKPVRGNIEVEGTLLPRDERNVDVKFEKVLLDNQPASPETAAQLESIAQQEINSITERMKYLAIQEIAISKGKIVFEGIFSFDELLCSFGLKNYCPTSNIIF